MQSTHVINLHWPGNHSYVHYHPAWVRRYVLRRFRGHWLRRWDGLP